MIDMSKWNRPSHAQPAQSGAVRKEDPMANPSQQGAKYRVTLHQNQADNRGLLCKSGVFEPGKQVSAADFQRGDEDLQRHLKAGRIERVRDE